MILPFLVVACLASAVLGRLILTKEQAWRTVTVRLPALLGLLFTAFAATTFWLVYAVACFAIGSFYGLSNWWWPQLFEVLEGDGRWLGPIIYGSWEP
jgi:hypothetical protein